ncbi:MAG: 50S ribosomal protein L10 [Patescibacteria group bacterium]|nr:50S ribosomal protein L10 [Patescibacteria group bacterium]
MPKTRVQKENTVSDLVDKFSRTKSVVFADFQGLKMPEIDELRNQCLKQGISYSVAKKTLVRIALEKAGVKEIDPKSIEGSLATVFGFEDEVAPAKLLATFSRAHEALKIKAGILEGRLIPFEEVMKLSKIPSRLELYAMLVRTMNGPVSGFANVLAGNLRKFMYALNAIKESKS